MEWSSIFVISLSFDDDDKESLPIPSHFKSAGHSPKDLKFIGIEKVKRKNIHLRRIRETFWIKKLGTIRPYGLNQNYGVGEDVERL